MTHRSSKEYDKAYREAHKDEAKKYAKEYYKANKNSGIWKSHSERKDYYLMRYYGITLDDYNRMFDEQNGCCAICSVHQSELKKSLCVDHDHNTGKVRGLLCDVCNKAIGLLGDSAERVAIASDYLKRNAP